MSYRGAGRFFLEALGALAAILVIALLVLFWRLTSEPVPMGFLTPYIERAFAGEGITVSIGSTALIWDGNNQEVQIEARDWRLRGPEGRPLAFLPRAELSLSLDALRHGTLGATRIELDRARLRVLRDEEGRFSFVDRADEEEGAPDLSAVAERVLAQLLSPADPSRPISYLREIDIRNARLLLDDRRVDRKVEVREAGLLIWRDTHGVSGRIDGRAQLGEAQARLRAGLHYDADREVVEGQLDFGELYAADLAPWSGLPELAGVAISLEGQATFDLPVNGELPVGEFRLEGQPGRIELPDVFAQPFEVLALSLEGALDGPAQSLQISAGEIRLGNEIDPGPVLELAGAVERRDQGVDLAVEANTRNVLVSDLELYWPTVADAGSRAWVIENIRAGSAPSGEVKARVTLPYDMAREPIIHELTGGFTFQDLEVHYLRPLPPVTGVQGQATFDADAFHFTVEEGALEALEVQQGDIHILGLQDPDQFLTVDLDASSPLPLVLEVLEHPRLNLLEDFGFRSAGSGGRAEANARFMVPLEREVTEEDIEIGVDATLRDVVLRSAVLGQDLTGGQLGLSLTHEGMQVNGSALLGDVEIQDLEWSESFKAANQSTRVSAYLPHLDETGRAQLNVDLAPYLLGPVSGQINLVSGAPGAATLGLSLNLNQAELNLKEIGWRKASGLPGELSGQVLLRNDRPVSMTDFHLNAEDLLLSEGQIEFDGEGDPSRLQFASAAFGENQLQQLSINLLPEGGSEIEIGGGRLDLEAFLEGEGEQEAEEAGDGVAQSRGRLKIQAPHLSELRFGDNRYLRTVELRLLKEGDHWQEMVLRGEVPRHLWRYRGVYDEADEQTVSKRVSLLYGRAADRPGYALNLEADDLGAFLRAVDLFDMVEGGELQVVGTSPGPLPQAPMDFEVWAADYSLVEAPAMARLLTIASLSGLGNVLAGEGIAFQRLTGNVQLADGRLSSDLVRAFGPSLGITARGHLDLEGSDSDVRGTLVPAYSINRVLGAIPLLGFLLTGGEGEGVLGVTYALSGPIDDPQFSVNPLSVLAPGFLRSLFNLPAGDSPVEPPSVFPPDAMRGQ